MSKPAPSFNVQVRITADQLKWMQTLGNGSAPAGIRRLLEIVAQESQPDPLATLGALLGRAAAVHALIPRSAQQPQTPAGSTTEPGQPAAPAGDGFEGWD